MFCPTTVNWFALRKLRPTGQVVNRPVRQCVYEMSMLTKRLQVLITPQQWRGDSRPRLSDAAVGHIVREAIDSVVGGVAAEERQRAVEEIARMKPGVEAIQALHQDPS
jgi:hypothetical protein